MEILGIACTMSEGGLLFWCGPVSAPPPPTPLGPCLLEKSGREAEGATGTRHIFSMLFWKFGGSGTISNPLVCMCWWSLPTFPVHA